MPPRGYSPRARSECIRSPAAGGREPPERYCRSDFNSGPYNVGSSERRYSYRTGSERPRQYSFKEDRRHFRRSSFDDHDTDSSCNANRARNFGGFRQELPENIVAAPAAVVPQSAVFIRGLTATVRESALKEWFEERLQLSPESICLVRIDRAPLTTGTVGFTEQDTADRAIEICNRQSFMGTELRLVRQKLQKGISLSEKRNEDEREKLERQRELDLMLRGRRDAVAETNTMADQRDDQQISETN